MPTTVNRRCIVILGPTASGKSKLGIGLAKKFHGVVISADSRQVYRGLDIGTGKVTAKEMRGVPHYLLDVRSPKSVYSVAQYAHDVQKVLTKLDPNQPIFLVGGSPFYGESIIEPHAFSTVPPNPALRKKLSRLTPAALIKILKKKDPRRAKNIDQHNPRRLIRAIEIASAKHIPVAPKLPPMRVLKIGLHLSRQKLFQNIDRRVGQRMKRGIINEVRRLHAQGVSWMRMKEFGLEYRIIVDFLQKKIDQPTMIARQKTSIHDFARRQLTWWRSEPDIYWLQSSLAAEKLVRRFLS